MSSDAAAALEFQKLAIALRETGAVRVRWGDFEAMWPAPVVSPLLQHPGMGGAHVRQLPTIPQVKQQQPASRLSPEEERMMQYQRELSGEP